jgi:patatin-like phospholipase/acyl hydrolase
MIVSYDFRNHAPVIFTKWAATVGPSKDKMNVKIRDAAQASSAAPIYFDPKEIKGISDALIDGGVIANSPAFYSYLHVKYVSKRATGKVRLVSIGTGENQPVDISKEQVNKVTWVAELGALITTVE